MLATKQFQFPLTSILFSIHIMEVNRNWGHLITDILQYIFFYVLQKNLSHTSLEWHEAE